jgi:hypothetical protein
LSGKHLLILAIELNFYNNGNIFVEHYHVYNVWIKEEFRISEAASVSIFKQKGR